MFRNSTPESTLSSKNSERDARVTLELVIVVGCLAVTLIIEKDLRNTREASLPREQDDSEKT
jgi:hypothetical protein